MIKRIISLLKSLYVSRRLCGGRFWAMPVRVSHDTKLGSLSGALRYSSKTLPVLRYGFDKVGIFDSGNSRPVLDVSGVVEMKGTANFGQGAKINVGPEGVLTIGDKFNNTAETAIVCQDRISIGSNVLVSWDTLIMDTDFHASVNTASGERRRVKSPVTIGDNVWIGARATVLKGAVIPDGCIVGAASLVNKAFTDPDTLIAGNPAKVVKENITRA